LKKSDDPYKALLAYRSTPLEMGYRPSELLMNRKLRTTVPMIPQQRQPEVPDYESVLTKNNQAKERPKNNFDGRRGVRELLELTPGDSVWVTDWETPGQVIERAAERSYILKTPGVYRRNKSHLAHMPNNKFEEPSDSLESTLINDDLPKGNTAIPPTEQVPEDAAFLLAPKVYSTRSKTGRLPGPLDRWKLLSFLKFITSLYHTSYRVNMSIVFVVMLD